ncbi:hypothetical protein PQR33_43420 [Paraburkholderia sediminicola]|uniref:hypothetical protein n=1 Tax=Paraburkholderia sediminicola TaxID=458836 RepID=UPI0038BAC4A3
MFIVEIDEASHIPALLANPAHNRMRLQAICRIIASARSDSGLGFLTSRRGSLGDRSPLQMLSDNSDFKLLQRMAAAYAPEWSRTAVKVFEGEHETEPSNIAPLYTAIAEIDPREPLRVRATEALHAYGYQRPLGPYPVMRAFTIFVERHTAGEATSIVEACIQVSAKDDFFLVRVRRRQEAYHESQPVPASGCKTVVDAAWKIIGSLQRH